MVGMQQARSGNGDSLMYTQVAIRKVRASGGGSACTATMTSNRLRQSSLVLLPHLLMRIGGGSACTATMTSNRLRQSSLVLLPHLLMRIRLEVRDVRDLLNVRAEQVLF